MNDTTHRASVTVGDKAALSTNSTASALTLAQGHYTLAQLEASYAVIPLREIPANEAAGSANFMAALIRYFVSGADNNTLTSRLGIAKPSGSALFVSLIGDVAGTVGTKTGNALSPVPAASLFCDTLAFTVNAEWSNLCAAYKVDVPVAYSPADNTIAHLAITELMSASHLIIDFAKGTSTSVNATVELSS